MIHVHMRTGLQRESTSSSLDWQITYDYDTLIRVCGQSEVILPKAYREIFLVYLQGTNPFFSLKYFIQEPYIPTLSSFIYELYRPCPAILLYLEHISRLP